MEALPRTFSQRRKDLQLTHLHILDWKALRAEIAELNELNSDLNAEVREQVVTLFKKVSSIALLSLRDRPLGCHAPSPRLSAGF